MDEWTVQRPVGVHIDVDPVLWLGQSMSAGFIEGCKLYRRFGIDNLKVITIDCV